MFVRNRMTTKVVTVAPDQTIPDAQGILTLYNLKHLPVGTHLRIGWTEVEVTQIGKECHSDCAIKKAVGKCVMPTEGIFAVVVREGTVRPGDEIEILEANT